MSYQKVNIVAVGDKVTILTEKSDSLKEFKQAVQQADKNVKLILSRFSDNQLRALIQLFKDDKIFDRNQEYDPVTDLGRVEAVLAFLDGKDKLEDIYMFLHDFFSKKEETEDETIDRLLGRESQAQEQASKKEDNVFSQFADDVAQQGGSVLTNDLIGNIVASFVEAIGKKLVPS